jgi:DNA polymerase-3 subunit delta
MAYSAPQDSLSSLTAQWAKGSFDPVYFFSGPEPLQKDEAVRALQKHFTKGNEAGLNVDKFDGETASAGEIINAYQTLPFLGTGGRLVLVRRANGLGTADAGRLAEVLEKPPAGNCLVLLWEEKADGRSALVKAARSAGKELVFWAPFENQMPRWISERVAAGGKTISPDAARLLLEAVGPNLPELVQEIEKLFLYVKDGPRIEASHVEEMGGGSRALQFMEWDRALWSRDRVKALALSRMMRAQGQAPEAILAQTVKAYQKLLTVKALRAEKVPLPEIWERLWIRTRGPQQALEEAVETHGWDELLDALEALAAGDENLKTGRMDGEAGLTLFLSRLLK